MRDRSILRPLGVFLLLALGWLAIGFVVQDAYWRLMLTLVPIWALLAVAWNIFSGYSGLVSFGHAAFFGLGAYLVALGQARFGITPWLGIPLAALLGGAAGAAIGYPTFRLRGNYFALAMLAYPLMLVSLFGWMGFQEVSVPLHREAPGWYMQFGDGRIDIAIALALLTIGFTASLLVERSRFGLSLLAIKQNELAAEAAGIDTVGRLPRASPVIFWLSWRVMASVRPPGMPESWTENCWSSRSVPSFSPSLSIRPDFMVASRMLLSSSRMNSDSNCLAASLTAFGSLVPAASLSASSDRASAASALPLLAGSELDDMEDMDEMVMHRLLPETPRNRPCRAAGVAPCRGVGAATRSGQAWA